MREVLYFICCDEQDCDRGRYSAAVACIFAQETIAPFRRVVIRRVREALGRLGNDATPLPNLHASALPGFLTDEQKIGVFSAMLSAVAEFCIAIYRVGYSWDDGHIQPFMGMARGSQSARLAAYTHLKHEISQLNLSSLCFLQEMDAQNHTRYLPFLSFRESQEQTIQLELLGYDFCNHLNNVVGYYFAPKDDHLIYAVDFVAYYLRLRSKGCVTSFQRDMLSSSPDLSPLIMRDQIIMAREKPV